MFELRPTTKYRRDIRRLKRRGFDLKLLMTAHDLLIGTGTLPDQYRPIPFAVNTQVTLTLTLRPIG